MLTTFTLYLWAVISYASSLKASESLSCLFRHSDFIRTQPLIKGSLDLAVYLILVVFISSNSLLTTLLVHRDQGEPIYTPNIQPQNNNNSFFWFGKRLCGLYFILFFSTTVSSISIFVASTSALVAGYTSISSQASINYMVMWGVHLTYFRPKIYVSWSGRQDISSKVRRSQDFRWIFYFLEADGRVKSRGLATVWLTWEDRGSKFWFTCKKFYMFLWCNYGCVYISVDCLVPGSSWFLSARVHVCT